MLLHPVSPFRRDKCVPETWLDDGSARTGNKARARFHDGRKNSDLERVDVVLRPTVGPFSFESISGTPSPEFLNPTLGDNGSDKNTPFVAERLTEKKKGKRTFFLGLFVIFRIVQTRLILFRERIYTFSIKEMVTVNYVKNQFINFPTINSL